MPTSVSVMLHTEVRLLTLSISAEYSHCKCTGSGVHTKGEAGDCQSCMLCEASASLQSIMAMVQAISSQSLQRRCVFACLGIVNTVAGHAKRKWSINVCRKGTGKRVDILP